MQRILSIMTSFCGGQEAIPYTNTEVNTLTVAAYLYRSVNTYV